MEKPTPSVENKAPSNSSEEQVSTTIVHEELHVPLSNNVKTETSPEISKQISTDDIAAKALLAK